MHNKRYKKSNKKIYGLCAIIVVLIYTISICYSTLQQQLEINGLVKVRRQENIRVTGIEVESSSNATSIWEEYDVKNVSARISLPNSESSITYKVEVTNFGNVDMGIYNIDGLDDRLTYTITDYTLKEKIEKSGNKREFKITIKYKDGSYDANNINYNILLNFEFRAYYNVTYLEFPYETESLPQEVMERDNLVVDLNNYEQGRYDIWEDYIELSNNRYTYKNNILTILSVEGDIEIWYKDISEIELVLRDNDANNYISEDLVGGMFRYQGTDNVNNWICFGATMDCSKTKEDIDKYMYRIIGVTPAGELALIKETAIKEDNVTQFQWNDKSSTSDCGEDGSLCTWENSKLFNRLNGLSDDNLFINSNYYDYLTRDSFWESMIDYHIWKYGESKELNTYDGDSAYSIESQFSDSVEAKIGLQYAHDYYYAYPRGNPENKDNAKNAWIHFLKDSFNTTIGYEWLISKDDVESIVIGPNGDVGNSGIESNYASGVRPVFYIIPGLYFKEGTTGEKNNPYIFDDYEPVSLGEFCAGHSNMGTCIINKKNFIEEVGNITSNKVGEMYRYQGLHDNVTNNYICFGTTDQETCTSGRDAYDSGRDKYMYRIIGVTEEGELALIKETFIREDNLISFEWNDKYTTTDCGSDGSGCTWANSKLFNRLNGLCNESNANCTGLGTGYDGQTNIFINNEYYDYLTSGSSWESIISNHTWKYGESKELNTYDGDSAYSIESQFSDSVEAKIGLQYVHDYYYAYPGGNPENKDNAFKSWIRFRTNLLNQGNIYEWLISKYGVNSTDVNAWIFSSIGETQAIDVNSSFGVRPVFYLTSDVKLSAATGEYWDPFIITNVNTD